MAAAASQSTKWIITTAFVHRAIQVFIAREVNNNKIFIYSHAVFNIIFNFSEDVAFLLKKVIKTVFAFLSLSQLIMKHSAKYN